MKQLLWLALLLGAGVVQGQSGWTRAPHSWFVKLDVTHLNATTYYNPDGTALSTSAFRQTALNAYAEYGVRPRLTVIAQWPLLRLNSFATTRLAAGIGDGRLELKYRLTGNRLPVAVSVAPEFPTGRANARAANKNNPAEFINLPTGDGEFNLWTTLAASKSLGHWYASAFTAYNFRTRYQGKKFRDQYQFGAEMGYNPWRPLWLNAKLRAQFSDGPSQHPELGFVRGDATTYTLLSAEAFYQITPRWGLTANYLTGADWIAPFRNIYVAPYFALGVVWQRP